VLEAADLDEALAWGRKAAVACRSARLNAISELFDNETLVSQVGTVLPLEAVRVAHAMLPGALHQRGKIVLKVAA
jgi:NADPH:quinone reductase-like Zn-dependent oxidoreductase